MCDCLFIRNCSQGYDSVILVVKTLNERSYTLLIHGIKNRASHNEFDFVSIS